MRIHHFATSDTVGGAAKATYRLHAALRAAGHRSEFTVRHKGSTDPDVYPVPLHVWKTRLRRTGRKLGLLRESRRGERMNKDRTPDVNMRAFFAQHPGPSDILCLHSVWHLLTTQAIRALAERHGCPLVRVLMDQEAVTGGCHYASGCDGYTRQCGRCPELESGREDDLSRTIWRRKAENLRSLPLSFVAPTRCTETWVRRSSLFRDHRVEFIPLAIDTALFRPADPCAARDALQVPQGKKVLFFGAASLQDPRKGMSYLVEALRHLAALLAAPVCGPAAGDLFLLVAGGQGEGLSLPFASKSVGYLRDEASLVQAYQAADLFVCPSVEDAGPMMIPEAMLCGTPTVAFHSGGAPDLIVSRENGYLAAYKDSRDMAAGLHQLLSDPHLPALGPAARRAAVARHDPAAVAAQHLAFYESLRAGN